MREKREYALGFMFKEGKKEKVLEYLRFYYMCISKEGKKKQRR